MRASGLVSYLRASRDRQAFCLTMMATNWWLGKMGKIGNGSSGTNASGSFSESLQKPIIWAKPSTRVTKGNAVTIWCKGPQTATHYQLYFEGSFLALERPKPSRSMTIVNFTIPQMTSHTAGKYTCYYQSGERQSKSSKGLNLIVTGECLVIRYRVSLV